jgi:hypothetical protein
VASRQLRAVFIATYAPTLCAIAAVALISLQTGINVSYFTRDPSEILQAPFYIGLLSNLGILIWSAAAAICLFGALLLARNSGAREWRAFLMAFGLLTMWLALDDVLTLHEIVIPNYLHVPQKLFLAMLGGCVLLIAVRFRMSILQTDYVLLAVAVGFFALSILFDAVQGRIALPQHHYFEDGTKLMGIVGWAVYLSRTTMQRVLVTQQPHR